MESLASRRDAAAAIVACKLLDGKGRGVLKSHVPEVVHLPASRARSKLSGIQIVNRVDAHSLSNTFDRSFIGSLHGLWARLPEEIKIFGDACGWLKVSKLIKSILVEKLDWYAADTDENEKKIGKRVAYVKRISDEIRNKVSK